MLSCDRDSLFRLERLIRCGRREARDELARLSRRRLSRSERVTLAKLAIRAGMTSLAARWLGPIVSEERSDRGDRKVRPWTSRRAA